MNLDDVAVFVEAERLGSLAAAARKLEIPAMAASRRLMALEELLGVRLAHRTTRALSLTPEGAAFLPHAQALLEDAANARAAVGPAGGVPSGLLRVTTSVPFGRKVAMAMMPDFLRDHPAVRVDLLLSDGTVDIVSQGIDLAIRIAPLRDNRLIARKLADSPRRLYAAPSYLAQRGVPRRIGELAGHDCLVISGVTHWSFESNGRLVRQKVSGRFSANSIEVLQQSCLDGFGLMTMAEWNAAPDVAAGRIVAVDLEDAQPEHLSIWAVYPTARLVSPKVRVFVDVLKRYLDQVI